MCDVTFVPEKNHDCNLLLLFIYNNYVIKIWDFIFFKLKATRQQYIPRPIRVKKNVLYVPNTRHKSQNEFSFKNVIAISFGFFGTNKTHYYCNVIVLVVIVVDDK